MFCIKFRSRHLQWPKGYLAFFGQYYRTTLDWPICAFVHNPKALFCPCKVFSQWKWKALTLCDESFTEFAETMQQRFFVAVASIIVFWIANGVNVPVKKFLIYFARCWVLKNSQMIVLLIVIGVEVPGKIFLIHFARCWILKNNCFCFMQIMHRNFPIFKQFMALVKFKCTIDWALGMYFDGSCWKLIETCNQITNKILFFHLKHTH